MRIADEDDELRAAAFAFLSDLSRRAGGFVKRQDLREFTFRDRRISLEQNMRGIRVVSGFPAAISILTTYRDRPEDRPYEDDIGNDGYPRYKWRGTDASFADNAALRVAMEERKPLAWFIGVAPGLYEAVFPVWLVDEEPDEHQFVVALDEAMMAGWQPEVHLTGPDEVRRREYALSVVRRRVHQPDFRRRVLAAYGRQCALCRLRHSELLDAAHIKEDADGGEPVISNGIAMCAIHHRAFDALVVGVTPKYVVEVRQDVLVERDGPTLQHALQGVHGTALVLPSRERHRPDVLLLEERYERFRKAG
ncbi:MAG: HNH endonuclease [Actinobacteria bacterium]|nr:HNH endonuclease [Actinomycetota bacterium]